MKYSIKSGKPQEVRSDCAVLSLKTARELVGAAVWRDYLGPVTGDFEDEVGKTLTVTLPANGKTRRLLIAGGADGDSLSASDYRRIVVAAATALKTIPARNAAWGLTAAKVTDGDGYWKTRTALTQLSQASYRFDQYKTRDVKPGTLNRVTVFADKRQLAGASTAVAHANALDEGLTLARDLGNQPPNVCNPTYLAREARRLGNRDSVTVKVVDERQMDKLGMNAFLSVSRGSDTPGKLIAVEYAGGRKNDAPVVLIGKGITFDTGGISLKPGPGMDEMKFDMCGAASVLGATKAAIEARLPVNLVTLVAAAENMPSGKASRPGDIVRSMSGQTVEILNTDAEGRLVLCDALTYAERFNPAAVIDVATLTGACVIALGAHATGLYANDDTLAQDLLGAGESSWDRAWRMPLWDDYQQQLKSPFADMANIGGREAGSVTAACFLSRFAERFKWAHLDVAGTAWHTGGNKNASGRPVPLLFQYLISRSQ